MSEQENREIASQEPAPLAIADGLLNLEAIQRAELMVEGVKKIKMISAKVTNSNDWTVQNNNPYLANTGCMKIAQLWGVDFVDREFVPEGGELREDEKGTYYLFTVQGRARFKGRIMEDVGTCSTRDDLFGTKKDDKGNRVFKSIGEVDLENIKKKAVTNLQGRLLKKILGLSYTMQELKDAGIDLSKSASVSYATGGAGGGVISEAQRKRLFAITMSGADDEQKPIREAVLKKHLKENYKIEHSKDILTKDYEAICTWAQKLSSTSTVGA